MSNGKDVRGKIPAVRILLIVLLAGAILGSAVGVFAKYVLQNRTGWKQVHSAEFFFTTDIAANDASHPYVSASLITFSVRNHDGLNFSAMDVKFQVTVKNAASGNAVEGAVITVGGKETNKGNLTGAAPDALNVQISGLPTGKYKITVASTAPYAKELILFFEVGQVRTAGTYRITDHGTWVELDLHTGTDTAPVTIAYSGYAPDNADDRMADWETSAGSGKLENVLPNAHYQLIFFVTDPSGSFTVTQSGSSFEEVTE